MNTKISEALIDVADDAYSQHYFKFDTGITRDSMRAALEAVFSHIHPQPAELAEQQGLCLPPLPHTHYNACGDGSEPLYTAEQMQDYARAALAATGKQQVGEVQGDARAQFEAWSKSAGLETKIYAHNDMYSHPVTRGAWMAWQHPATRQTGTQEAIAWQINAKRSGWGWENCTRECYEDTLRTGRYMGLPAGARDVEVRQLYAAPPAQGIDLGQFVPTEKSVPARYAEDDSEAQYNSGWNDCRGAMLALIDQARCSAGGG